jgi:hypothetical protein
VNIPDSFSIMNGRAVAELRKPMWGELLIVCGARRTPGSHITCEKPALHREGCAVAPGHACGGRGKRGQWFFWFAPRGKPW